MYCKNEELTLKTLLVELWYSRRWREVGEEVEVLFEMRDRWTAFRGMRAYLWTLMLLLVCIQGAGTAGLDVASR